MVHRGGGVIVAKMWWVDWGPQVMGGWGHVWWVLGWLRKGLVGWLRKGVVGSMGSRGGSLVGE